jgi:hypothetical protein
MRTPISNRLHFDFCHNGVCRWVVVKLPVACSRGSARERSSRSMLSSSALQGRELQTRSHILRPRPISLPHRVRSKHPCPSMRVLRNTYSARLVSASLAPGQSRREW